MKTKTVKVAPTLEIFFPHETDQQDAYLKAMQFRGVAGYVQSWINLFVRKTGLVDPAISNNQLMAWHVTIAKEVL